MKFHDELNPKLWDGLELKPDVKEKLNEIAEAFKEYLDIPEDAILDIRITGSSASYNYTEYSDLDLHLIIDYEKVHEDCPLVEGYLWSYKSQFNANHDISIYDVPVELYAEDSKQDALNERRQMNKDIKNCNGDKRCIYFILYEDVFNAGA